MSFSSYRQECPFRHIKSYSKSSFMFQFLPAGMSFQTLKWGHRREIFVSVPTGRNVLSDLTKVDKFLKDRFSSYRQECPFRQESVMKYNVNLFQFLPAGMSFQTFRHRCTCRFQVSVPYRQECPFRPTPAIVASLETFQFLPAGMSFQTNRNTVGKCAESFSSYRQECPFRQLSFITYLFVSTYSHEIVNLSSK